MRSSSLSDALRTKTVSIEEAVAQPPERVLVADDGLEGQAETEEARLQKTTIGYSKSYQLFLKRKKLEIVPCLH